MHTGHTLPGPRAQEGQATAAGAGAAERRARARAGRPVRAGGRARARDARRAAHAARDALRWPLALAQGGSLGARVTPGYSMLYSLQVRLHARMWRTSTSASLALFQGQSVVQRGSFCSASAPRAAPAVCDTAGSVRRMPVGPSRWAESAYTCRGVNEIICCFTFRTVTVCNRKRTYLLLTQPLECVNSDHLVSPQPRNGLPCLTLPQQASDAPATVADSLG